MLREATTDVDYEVTVGWYLVKSVKIANDNAVVASCVVTNGQHQLSHARLRYEREKIRQCADTGDWSYTLINTTGWGVWHRCSLPRLPVIVRYGASFKVTQEGWGHWSARQALEWITSFLGNRKMRVRVEGNFSGWEEVLSGVPQIPVQLSQGSVVRDAWHWQVLTWIA
jgi:hypothetical protein